MASLNDYNEPSKLKDLNITKDEFDKISEALKKPEFRKLLAEYAEEISNPENRKKYEEDIVAMEREQGRDVQFINPTAAWVIKSFDKKINKKVFINIASNEKIEKPSSSREAKGKSSGLNWKVPHSLSPPREDVDKEGNRCQVVDAVFHPDTIRMAESNKKFKEMIQNIAFEAVCKNFQFSLDPEKMKVPKNLTYKGKPTAAVIRKPVEGQTGVNPDGKNLVEEKMKDIISEAKTKERERKRSEKNETSTRCESSKKQPAYKIVYSKNADMQDFVLDRSIGVDPNRPNEIRVTVELPGIESAVVLQLDVFERSVHLENEDFLLDIPLPYAVDEANSSAKFDKKKQSLSIVMPIFPEPAQKPSIVIDEVEEEETPLIEVIESKPNNNNSLSEKTIPAATSKLPESTSVKCYPDISKAAETINRIELVVQGRMIDFDSVVSELNKTSYKLEFTSRGQGGFPIFYQLILKGCEEGFSTGSFYPLKEATIGGQLRIVLVKAKPQIWNECQVGVDEENLKIISLELDDSVDSVTQESSNPMRIISVTSCSSPDSPCRLTAIADVADSDDDNAFDCGKVESAASPRLHSPRQVAFDIGGGIVEQDEGIFTLGCDTEGGDLESFLAGLDGGSPRDPSDDEDDLSVENIKVICDSFLDKPSILKSLSSIENIYDEPECCTFGRRRKSVSFSDKVDNLPFRKAEPACAVNRVLKNRRRRERRRSTASSPREESSLTQSLGTLHKHVQNGKQIGKKRNRRRTVSTGSLPSATSTLANYQFSECSSPATASAEDLRTASITSDINTVNTETDEITMKTKQIELSQTDSGIEVPQSPSENVALSQQATSVFPKKSSDEDKSSFQPQTCLSWSEANLNQPETNSRGAQLELSNNLMFELDASS